MLQSSDIRKKAMNKWPQFRKHLVSLILFDENDDFFPLKIIGDKTPINDWSKMIDEYSEIISYSKEKTNIGYSIVWEERKTRDRGTQSFIKEIYISGEEDYLYLTNGEERAKAIKSSLKVLSSIFLSYSTLSHLEKWIEKNTKEIENKDKDEKYWSDIVSVLKWTIETKDRNQYYIREIPLYIHTKFIEKNSSTIISLFRALIGKEDIRGASLDITEELNLKNKPILIRFRMLDTSFPYKEMALDSSSYNNLQDFFDLSRIKRVYVIENEAVYLSFPIVEGEMVVFGSGFKSKILEAPWLDSTEIFYFGDIDEHGFLILSLFRSIHPKTISFLMDKETYNTFLDFAVKGEKVEDTLSFSNLNGDEKEMLSLLKASLDQNRLEQERIDQSYIKTKLEVLRENNE